MGRFLLGSTVVLLFPVRAAGVQPGMEDRAAAIRMGEAMASRAG